VTYWGNRLQLKPGVGKMGMSHSIFPSFPPSIPDTEFGHKNAALFIEMPFETGEVRLLYIQTKIRWTESQKSLKLEIG